MRYIAAADAGFFRNLPLSAGGIALQPIAHTDHLSLLRRQAGIHRLTKLSHPFPGADDLQQIRITKEVLHSCRHDTDVKRLVKGFMIESYIEDGAQKIGECLYGKSITDPCLGWDKTERLIYDIADLI